MLIRATEVNVDIYELIDARCADEKIHDYR